VYVFDMGKNGYLRIFDLMHKGESTGCVVQANSLLIQVLL